MPIATVVSIDTNLPMLIRRKEPKTYGTKKLIDGEYSSGDNVIVIEDVITSGASILETVVVSIIVVNLKIFYNLYHFSMGSIVNISYI